MVKLTILALVSTTIIGIQLSASGRVYESGTSKLEATGVCRMSETEISCWDMDGKVSKPLTDLAAASVTANDGRITLIVGRKNRWLVVRRQGMQGANYNPLKVKGHSSFFFGGRSGTYGDMIAISTEPDRMGKIDVEAAMYGIPGSPPVDLKLQKGESIRYESVEATVVNWAPGEMHGVGMRATPGGTPTWKIELMIHPVGSGEQPTLAFATVGTAGQLVEHVDMSGNAVFLVPGRGSGTAWSSSRVWTLSQTPERLTLGTSVNPEQIDFLRVSGTHRDRVVLRGFPLDPAKR